MTRIKWIPEVDDRFIDLCIEHKKSNSSASPCKRIAKLLSAQFGKECVWKQCLNRYSELKTKLTT